MNKEIKIEIEKILKYENDDLRKKNSKCMVCLDFAQEIELYGETFCKKWCEMHNKIAEEMIKGKDNLFYQEKQKNYIGWVKLKGDEILGELSKNNDIKDYVLKMLNITTNNTS